MPEQQNGDSNIDVLADVLDTLRLRGSFFFRSALAAPWGMALKAEGTPRPRFHIVFSGTCYVGAAEVDPLKIDSCEIVMIANGSAHWIADKADRTLVSSNVASDACELGTPLFQQGEITHRIMCGVIHFDQESPHPLLISLPQIVHFAQLKSNAAIWGTVSVIEAEIDRTGRYTSQIVDRLAEVLFLQLLDHYANENKGSAGFLGALKDRRINNALRLIHEDPALDWTLSTLGKQVGMSPATLTRHFQSSIGVAPMTYLANWRLAKAYHLVKYTVLPLSQIAESVGYSSVGTLNKAFQRFYDRTPTNLRTQLLTDHNHDTH